MAAFPSVAEFYKGRNILLTGGTGFIGKVFIEKILRCCPDIGDIYLLIRAKRNETVHERISALFKQKVCFTVGAALLHMFHVINLYAGSWSRLPCTGSWSRLPCTGSWTLLSRRFCGRSGAT